MNTFCCTAPDPVSPAAPATLLSAPPPIPPMIPPHPPLPPSSASAPGSSGDSSPLHRANQNGGTTRWPSASASDHGVSHRSAPSEPSAPASLRPSFYDALDHHGVSLNNIVGNGISGLLHKWVNYGKGWRPRWFVLQDGVLSYYKVHGPHRIEVSQELDKGAKVIGEDSRRMSRRRSRHYFPPRKPVGEVHLKVSSIRQSRSDDKRFSIFTGTKRLHLRAETRDDRLAWMEALRAMKDMYPRISTSELMTPVDNVVASTEKLRNRLEEENVSNTVIQDCEQIMKGEFVALQNQLVLLNQKQAVLVDTLRQLEIEERGRITKAVAHPPTEVEADLLPLLTEPSPQCRIHHWKFGENVEEAPAFRRPKRSNHRRRSRSLLQIARRRRLGPPWPRPPYNPLALLHGLVVAYDGWAKLQP
ncbi:hypothetical protein ZIOFF_026977 [Zingiber officinale]|uniref:PH domain-containing protein n=1 Tax=Zingiber officinale TaxID=94328 RepID=A0A8J5LIB1_ZINOF|nr:hypothetical protein ZIOFF_026977 [Zingiber officinale]